MAGNQNPNAPAVIGCEWFPHTEAARTLDSAMKAAAMTLPSNAAETIDELHLMIPDVTIFGYVLAEVYEAGSEVGGANPATVTYRPNADHTNVNWEDEGGAVVNLYQSIDEVVLDTGDYVTPIDCTFSDYLFNVASAAFPAAKRVTNVKFSFWSAPRAAQTNVVYDNGTSVATIANNVNLFTTGGKLFEYDLGEINPVTALPWTQADIADFDGVAGFGWQDTTCQLGSTAVIYQAWIEVSYVDENRVAYGNGLALAQGWIQFPLQEPDGTDNWPKANATDYTILLRRNPFGTSSCTWRYLESGDPPSTDVASYLPTLSTDGYVTALGDAGTRGYAAIMVTTAPADSDDSQPYSQLQSGECRATSDLEQEISGAAVADYQVVQFLCQPQVNTSSDLTVRVRRRADNVQMGGTLTLTVDQVNAMQNVGGGWRRVVAILPSAGTLAAATQYYVEWTSVEAGGTSSSWLVAYLDTDSATGPEGETATYGGTTDRFYDGTAENDEDDAPATFAQLPDPPTNLAVALAQQDLTGDGTDCSIDDLDYASITWTKTALGADFGRYEIQRSVDGGTTWAFIAYITDEDIELFRDYEGPLGVLSTYRMRVQRGFDGAVSAWTASDTATPTARVCEVLFVSNEDPTLNVGYDRGPRIEYRFLDADEVRHRKLYGRDYQAAFAPLELRGDAFNLDDLLINVAGEPATPGRAVFDEIQAMATAVLSYVAVKDADGRVWYASLQCMSGRRREPGARYFARVAVTEITDTPSTPDVA